MTQRRLRLLLAEGSHGEAAAALHELYAGSDPGLDLTVVSTIATLLPTIKAVDPEVILLDLGLNLREAMDAVHLVHRTAPAAPVIVIAETAEKERAIRSLAEGGVDHVLTGHIDTQTLERSHRTELEQQLAVHNQTRSPWGPIDLRTIIGSWIPQDAGTFAEFLDGVESRLRLDVAEMKS